MSNNRATAAALATVAGRAHVSRALGVGMDACLLRETQSGDMDAHHRVHPIPSSSGEGGGEEWVKIWNVHLPGSDQVQDLVFRR